MYIHPLVFNKRFATRRSWSDKCSGFAIRIGKPLRWRSFRCWRLLSFLYGLLTQNTSSFIIRYTHEIVWASCNTTAIMRNHKEFEPKTSLLCELETGITQTGLGWQQLERIAQDRRRWREVVHGLCSRRS